MKSWKIAKINKSIHLQMIYHASHGLFSNFFNWPFGFHHILSYIRVQNNDSKKKKIWNSQGNVVISEPDWSCYFNGRAYQMVFFRIGRDPVGRVLANLEDRHCPKLTSIDPIFSAHLTNGLSWPKQFLLRRVRHQIGKAARESERNDGKMIFRSGPGGRNRTITSWWN